MPKPAHLGTQVLDQPAPAPEAPPLTPEELKAVEAIVAESGVEQDQARAALDDIRFMMQMEPAPAIATNEAEAFLGRVARRHYLIEQEAVRIKEQMTAMLKGLAAKKAALDWLFGRQAEEYTRQLVSGKKAKSIKLAHGTAGFRMTQGSVELLPEKMEEIKAWAKANCPTALVTRVDIVKTPIKEHILATGDQVPGVIYHEPKDEFYLK